MRCAAFLPLLFAVTCAAQDLLPGTTALTDSGDFSARMVQGINDWLERETTRVAADRQQRWREAATGNAWPAFVATQRENFAARSALSMRARPVRWKS